MSQSPQTNPWLAYRRLKARGGTCQSHCVLYCYLADTNMTTCCASMVFNSLVGLDRTYFPQRFPTPNWHVPCRSCASLLDTTFSAEAYDREQSRDAWTLENCRLCLKPWARRDRMLVYRDSIVRAYSQEYTAYCAYITSSVESEHSKWEAIGRSWTFLSVVSHSGVAEASRGLSQQATCHALG